MDPQVCVFILAGGSGERFWPMSRTSRPKHLLKLFGERTLLENTVRRLEEVVPVERVFVLTNVAQRDAAVANLPFLPPENIVAEPAKRDTAPACALATGLALRRFPGSVCVLLPADAMIHDIARFQEQFAHLVRAAAERDTIATFAIRPTFPATGYGYLHLGQTIDGDLLEVTRFVEKPDEATAKSYMESGEYGWNAGIFAWRADWFASEAARLAPEIAAFLDAFPESGIFAFLRTAFPKLPRISVDYAILEKTSSVVAIRAEFDWDDVGAWTALPHHLGVDESGNSMQGHVVALNSENNIAVANGRLIALCGVKDLVVVETADAVLVCHKDAAQDIKKLDVPDALR